MSEKSVFEKFKIFNKLKNKEILNNVKHFYVFECYMNKSNAIIVTNDDKIYAFGSNSNGVLGFGHYNKVKELTIVEELCDKGISEFKNSLFHTIARTSDGKLYCWGRNKWGLLGNGRVDPGYEQPQLNEILIRKQIIEMSCGKNHSLVLTSDGEVYAWGSIEYGKIGNRKSCKSNENECQSMPYFVNEFKGEKVKSISCGLFHSMALTESGRVYSWGSNWWGQLGRNTGQANIVLKIAFLTNKIYLPDSFPKPIEMKEEIIFERISCGQEHSLLLSCEGEIYVFGRNLYRELGVNTESNTQLLPTKLNNSEKFKQIASHYSLRFSAALSANGLYYIWGDVKEEEIIKEPKETQFKSLNELFSHHFGITFNILEINIEMKNKMINFYKKNVFTYNGRYIHEFKQIKDIGEGNFGKVYKVLHLFDEQHYAMKKINIKGHLKLF